MGGSVSSAVRATDRQQRSAGRKPIATPPRGTPPSWSPETSTQASPLASLEKSHFARVVKEDAESVGPSYELSRTASAHNIVVTTAHTRENSAPHSFAGSELPSLFSTIREEKVRDAAQAESEERMQVRPASRYVQSNLSRICTNPPTLQACLAEANTSPAAQPHSRRTSRSLPAAPSPVYGVDVVQIERSSPLPHGAQTDLDDFELAYARGVQDGNLPAAAADSFAVVQYIRPLPRAASRGCSGAVLSSNSRISRSLSVLDLGISHPPLYTPSDVDETIAFVTLRRAGFSACHACATDLPYKAKFCPECGASAAESCELATKNSWFNTPGASRASSLATPSLLAASPKILSDSSASDSAASTKSVTAKPGHSHRVTESALNESNVFTLQRRHAFVRYVKVLRSRDMLGMGTSGTVYRAIDTRSGQQLAVKESLINQNSQDELAAVRNELRQLAELRHPYIVEYFGCRVEAVEDNYVAHFQSSVISSHASAIASRRASRRGSAASPVASATYSFNYRNASERGGSSGMDSEGEEAAVTRQSLSAPSMPRRKKSVVITSTIRVLILMERVECGTLSNLLCEFPRGMPEQAVRRFAAQLVDAVRYVHDCGLSHRDIKLDNILLASDGTIRLTDFGCAVRGVGSVVGNGIHTIAGTPAYMPPESLTSLNHASVDWYFHGMAQDVWALGCVVHHLLTAQAPWSATKMLSPYALLLHIQSHDFPLCAETLSRDALDFCSRCFERDPRRRITMADLAAHPFVCHARQTQRSTNSSRFSQSGGF